MWEAKIFWEWRPQMLSPGTSQCWQAGWRSVGVAAPKCQCCTFKQVIVCERDMMHWYFSGMVHLEIIHWKSSHWRSLPTSANYTKSYKDICQFIKRKRILTIDLIITITINQYLLDLKKKKNKVKTWIRHLVSSRKQITTIHIYTHSHFNNKMCKSLGCRRKPEDSNRSCTFTRKWTLNQKAPGPEISPDDHQGHPERIMRGKVSSSQVKFFFFLSLISIK